MWLTLRGREGERNGGGREEGRDEGWEEVLAFPWKKCCLRQCYI